ncbi:MAG TPA: TrmH family RNA methyltransferase, partial [Planctomicrobium sp.]|nr:TrmH family RNA methyltransferase [Planctomicrobium sp.]
CDQVCQIPPLGQVDSLNVSVAAGIMMSSLSRP